MCLRRSMNAYVRVKGLRIRLKFEHERFGIIPVSLMLYSFHGILQCV